MGFCMKCGGREISYEPRKRITCNDGTTLSVQVGTNLYCTPRDDNGEYTHVEVGFPSVIPPDSWRDYGDGEFPCDVYGYVPVQLVEEFIAMHGGRKFWI